MAEWIRPVTDRTQADVDFAAQKIAEWISGESSAVYDLKGCMNVSDINRIEGNIAYLADKLEELEYTNTVYARSWSEENTPTERDINRILDNVRALISSFYQQDKAPIVPSDLLRYDSVNAVEENLLLIKELLEVMVGSFRKASTFQSGSTFRLPTRR